MTRAEDEVVRFARAEDEVVRFASELIAIDTTNAADAGGPGTERPAAEYVAGLLAEVGYRNAGQCSGLQTGGEGLRGEGRQARACIYA